MSNDLRLIMFGLGIVMAVFMFKLLKVPTDYTNPNRTVDTVLVQQDTFKATQSSVYELLCSTGVQHPDIVLRQSILETGHFKSPACVNKYNLFGFMDSDGVKVYRSYEESVKAYKYWQDSWYPKGTNYYLFLDSCGYAEDTTYTDKLKQIKIDV